jgi:hypothetical protein
VAHVEQLPGGPTLGAATVEDLPSDAAMRRRVAGSLEDDLHLRASCATSPDRCVGKRFRHEAIELLAGAPVKQPTSTGTARTLVQITAQLVPALTIMLDDLPGERPMPGPG